MGTALGAAGRAPPLPPPAAAAQRPHAGLPAPCLADPLFNHPTTPWLGCREEEATEVHGHITSLAVARTHRKLGLATKLMAAAREQAWCCCCAGVGGCCCNVPLLFAAVDADADVNARMAAACLVIAWRLPGDATTFLSHPLCILPPSQYPACLLADRAVEGVFGAH